MSLPDLKLVKLEPQWKAHSGERISLSAEWGLRGLDGLHIARVRAPELKRTPGEDPPPAAWKVQLPSSYMADSSAVDPQAREVVGRLCDKCFSTRRDALLAVSVELWRIDT